MKQQNLLEIQLYKPKDERTLELLSNYTRSMNDVLWDTKDVLIKIDDRYITARTRHELLHSKLASLVENFYYDTSYYPSLPGQYANSNLDKYLQKYTYNPECNSIWQDWNFPDYWTKFSLVDNVIYRNPKYPNNWVTIEQYRKQMCQDIESHLKKIYDTHNNILLLYSGGIDCIAILSFLVKLGLDTKTKIVYCRNHVGYTEPRTFPKEQALGFEVTQIDFNYDDLVFFCNQPSPFKFREYLLYYVHTLFPDHYFINGSGGNNVGLHTPYQMTESGSKFKSGDWYGPEFNSDQTNPVAQSFAGKHHYYYDPSLTISLQNTSEIINKISMPMHCTNESTEYYSYMELFPWIDYSSMPAEYYSNAEFLREIIETNAGKPIANLISKRSSGEFAPTPNCNINLRDIDPKYLKIEFNRICNPKGVAWLKREIQQAQQTGYIDPNTLRALKFNNWLVECSETS